MRRALVSDIGGFRPGFEGTQDYDLWLRAITQTPRIHHVPKVLYHWRKIAGSAAAVVDAKVYALDNMRRTLQEHADRNGLNAEVVPGLALSLFRVKRRITGAPVVAICRFRSAADARQLTGSAAVLTPETTWPNVRVVADAAPASSPASLTRRLNAMIASCDVEYVVLAEDGVEILTDDWIEGLLEYAQDPGVGVVGARLFRPDGRLHHVGIATGVGGVAAHLFQAEPGDAPGWNGGAITPRNYSAVSAALMMTRASVWRQVGGFEPALRSDFFDVDYCLKVREAGLRVVYTPFVEAVYSGPACAGAENPDDRRWMLKRWGAVLSRDPYYNPNLTIDFTDCRARRPAPR
jgi:hypothetical protein